MQYTPIFLQPYNPAGYPTSSIGKNWSLDRNKKNTCPNPRRSWLILQFFPEIQDHPYPLQMQNPVKGMDDIAIL